MHWSGGTGGAKPANPPHVTTGPPQGVMGGGPANPQNPIAGANNNAATGGYFSQKTAMGGGEQNHLGGGGGGDRSTHHSPHPQSRQPPALALPQQPPSSRPQPVPSSTTGQQHHQQQQQPTAQPSAPQQSTAAAAQQQQQQQQPAPQSSSSVMSSTLPQLPQSIPLSSQSPANHYPSPVAISGANTAAAHGGPTAVGVYYSGTRTTFTDVAAGGTYSFAGVASSTTGGAGGGGNGLNAPGDGSEEEINQLLKELENSVDTAHASAVMEDAVVAIESRAMGRFDPLSRDTFLEQRIRELLAELTRPNNERSMMLAAKFIETLLPIPYTNPQPKFTRLYRSLSAIMQCGQENPAREARRVFKVMLRCDSEFQETDPPLKAFLPKELKDTCDLAIMQLHGRLQQGKGAYEPQYLSIMLACAATAEASPRYLVGKLRSQIIQLATTLAGTSDTVLQQAAYECLVAIFSQVGMLRQKELVLENRRVCEESMRTLNSGHFNEGAIISTLKALRALVSSRGLQSTDRQVMPQLCVLVTEQHRITSSPAVKAAVCDLVPLIAQVDISAAPRRTTYCAIIMEPVKNVRNERSKANELHNVAAFIDSVGYSVIDPTNRTNLDSILHRYISRPETQNACWNIVAAICTSQTKEAFRRAHTGRSARSTAAYSLDNILNNGSRSTTDRPNSTGPRGGVRSGGDMLPTTPHSPSAQGARTSQVNSRPTPSGAAAAASHFGSASVGSPLQPQQRTSSHQHRRTSPTANRDDETTSLVLSRSSSNSSRSPGTRTGATSPARSPTAQTIGGASAGAAGANFSQLIEELVRRCIPHIVNAALSAELVGYLSTVQESVPAVASDIQHALSQLVDTVLKDPTTASGVAGGNTASTAVGASSTSGSPRASSGAMSALRPPEMGSGPGQSGSGNTSSSPASTMGMSRPSSTLSGQNRLTLYFRPNEGVNAMGRHFGDGVGSMVSPSRSSTGPGGGVQTTNMLSGSNVDASYTAFSPVASPTHGNAGGSPISPYAVVKSDLSVALEAFSQRPVTSVQQLEDIKTVVVPFQSHSDVKVRKQSSKAIITSLIQWIRYAKEHKTSTYSTRVTEILESYVKNVLNELDPSCRLDSISLLTSATSLRSFLSEQRILSALLSFLNDTPQVREKTVELLVAITQDPKPSSSVVAVQQSLYVTVESCVVVLEYTTEVRTLIRSLGDLRTFTRLCLRPLTNHLGRIFYAFRKKLQEINISDVVLLSILKTLEGILTALAKEERWVLQYQDDVLELFHSVVRILKDASSPSLSHSAIDVLVAMIRICCTPHPIDPQRHYDLIGTIVQVYTRGSATREELVNMLTLFGQLGAIDPSAKPPGAIVKKKSEEGTLQDEADMELTYDYTVIVYRTLSRMLDVTLSDAVCSQALRTLLQFMRQTQDRKELVGGVHAVRAVLQIAKRSADSPVLRIESLHVLAAITLMRHERVARLMLPEIVVLLEQLWTPSDHALFSVVLDVVSALKPGKLSGKEQSESWAWLYPRLVDVALQDRTESRDFCLRIVEIVLNASYIPPHCIPIVFPMLNQFVQQSDQLVEVRSQSLCAAVHIVCELKAVQYFASLLHGIRTLTRHCELNDTLGPRLSTPGVRESLKVLAALHPSGRATIKMLRDRISETDERPATLFSSHVGFSSSVTTAPLGPPISNSMNSGTGVSGSSGPGSSGGVYLRRSTGPGPSAPTPAASAVDFDDDDDANGTTSNAAPLNQTTATGMSAPGSSPQEIQLFMKHIEVGVWQKENKLREWFQEFQKYIILVSPQPAFRMMVDLFDKHEPLRRELFHPSFKALYEVLTAEQIKKVNEVLTVVLNCTDRELTTRCLGLADYLDHNQPNLSDEVVAALSKMEQADPHKLVYASESASPLLFRAANQPIGAPSSTTENSTTMLSDGTSKAGAGGQGGSQHPQAQQLGVQMGQRKQSDVGSQNEGTFTFESPNDAYLGADGKQGDAMTLRSSCDNTAEAGQQKGCHNVNVAGGDSFNEASTAMAGMQPGIRPLSLRNTSGADASKQQRSTQTHTQLAAHTPLKSNVLFSPDNIVKAAERTRMYDKALSYLENKLLVTLSSTSTKRVSRELIQTVVWPLAWLYSQQEMQDSVVGLFRAIRFTRENSDGFGYELLRWWMEAQRVYARVIGNDPLRRGVSLSVVEGYARTLCFCGEWAKALDLARRVCYSPESSIASSTVATCGAMSAWLLGSWDDVSRLADAIGSGDNSSNHVMRLFYVNGATLHAAIKDASTASYDDLRAKLTQAKLAVDESLRTLLPLSYSHAYENLTMLQHFNEMEELIDYCHSRSPKLRTQMVERWNRRFMCLKPDTLQPSLRSLMLHSLALSTSEMSDMILHFCEAMSADYPQLTQWAMDWVRRGAFPASPKDVTLTEQLATLREGNPNVTVGYIMHVWSQGRRREAVRAMEAFLADAGEYLEENNAVCYGNAELRLGMWKQEMHADSFWKRGYRDEELAHFHKAIRSVPSSYEAWHSWGLMNYRVQQRDHKLEREQLRTFVEAAHQGFVAAICLCENSSEALPAIMRLLQLWVIHNGVALLKETVADSICRIPVDHWVQCISQLIGHLGNDNHDVREVISMILRSLCEVHPQAVVFPLMVVLMSDDYTTDSGPQIKRKHDLVQSIIQYCPKRIRTEAETVAKLLVDVSAIPIEKIREHLSQVATAWNPNAEYEEDPEEVHRRLKATLEIFNANRKHLLYTVGDIGQFVQMVIDDDRRGGREKAASIVNQLVDEISKHVADKLGKEPQRAMEPLLRLRNLSIAVFGEYDIQCRDNYPTIASFSSKLDVIPSKKRPRRIQLNGSDGCLYSYCLKGNEDIRMDERVMQLFGMVNVLLSHTRCASSAYIHRFPVIPITSNVGLLGWVENANTINNTICNYRTSISHVRTHQESSTLRAYVESFGQWDRLSVIQRTEVLDYVMSCENCEAVDVSRAMWHRANTAEQWLGRRTAFTTSLATMSMVGYILGLGDRHLGNILLSMSTGKIVHIDFGDSFDVGRLRHVLPETVPFRLTRMLTNAMEVFGVDGVFRASATRTQVTLHKNRDSIMALLSAFVYDPIVQHKGKMKSMMEKSRSPQDVAERVRNKLRGVELAVNNDAVIMFNTAQDSCRRPDLMYMSKAFDDDAFRVQSMALTPEAQVNFLIDEATRIDNYTTLYFGWGPLW